MYHGYSDNHHLFLPLATTAAIILATAAFFLFRTRPGKKVALINKTEWTKFPLIEKQVISHNTALYRFALPSKDCGLELPIGQVLAITKVACLSQHISVMAQIDGKEIVRSYTPTSLSTDLGHFDLVIKSYQNGLLSKWFSTLKIGDMAHIRGPKGNFNYKPNMCRAFGMIAGGTGVTPMLQIVHAILSNPQDKTEISLIFANVNEEDILLRGEIDALAKKHKNFSVYHVLNNPPSGWNGGTGFVSKQMISDHCPPPAKDVKILICGPPPMVKAMQLHCEDLGYEKARSISKLEDQIFKF